MREVRIHRDEDPYIEYRDVYFVTVYEDGKVIDERKFFVDFPDTKQKMAEYIAEATEG